MLLKPGLAGERPGRQGPPIDKHDPIADRDDGPRVGDVQHRRYFFTEFRGGQRGSQRLEPRRKIRFDPGPDSRIERAKGFRLGVLATEP
jgi:hypothetical protein